MFAIDVNEIIPIAFTEEANIHFEFQLDAKWKFSDLGEAKFVLSIAVTENRADHSFSLSPTALIDRIVSKVGQPDSHPVLHPVDTSMVAGLCLLRHNRSALVLSFVTAWIKKTPYRAPLQSFNYISVGRLAGFLDCYCPKHWDAAARVLRYLKGTRLLSFQLGGATDIKLVGYSDSDYANCPDNSHSIGGYCFSLGAGAISWASQKQKSVADSSCYAEYIALHEALHKAVFLRKLLATLLGSDMSPTPLYCDNDAVYIFTQGHV